jgi:hypothetical protein
MQTLRIPLLVIAGWINRIFHCDIRPPPDKGNSGCNLSLFQLIIFRCFQGEFPVPVDSNEKKVGDRKKPVTFTNICRTRSLPLAFKNKNKVKTDNNHHECKAYPEHQPLVTQEYGP